MSIRVHCEICGQHMAMDTPVAVLALPELVKPAPTVFGLIGPRVEHVHHHFCEGCGRALYEMVVALGQSLIGARR